MRAVSERSGSRKSRAGTQKSASPPLSSAERASQKNGSNGLTPIAGDVESMMLRVRLMSAISTVDYIDPVEHMEAIAREIERVRAMRTNI